MLALNAVLAASLAPLLYLLLTRCFRCLPGAAVWPALAAAVYPTVTVFSQVALSENLLLPLTVVWLICFGKLLDARSRPASAGWGIGFGACAIALLAVHGRMATAAALTAAALVFLALRRRAPGLSALLGLGVMACGYLLVRRLDAFLISANNQGKLPSEAGERLANLDSVSGWLAVARNVLGETWYVMVATLGVFVIYVITGGLRELGGIRRRDAGTPELVAQSPSRDGSRGARSLRSRRSAISNARTRSSTAATSRSSSPRCWRSPSFDSLRGARRPGLLRVVVAVIDDIHPGGRRASVDDSSVGGPEPLEHRRAPVPHVEPRAGCVHRRRRRWPWAPPRPWWWSAGAGRLRSRRWCSSCFCRRRRWSSTIRCSAANMRSTRMVGRARAVARRATHGWLRYDVDHYDVFGRFAYQWFMPDTRFVLSRAHRQLTCALRHQRASVGVGSSRSARACSLGRSGARPDAVQDRDVAMSCAAAAQRRRTNV